MLANLLMRSKAKSLQESFRLEGPPCVVACCDEELNSEELQKFLDGLEKKEPKSFPVAEPQVLLKTFRVRGWKGALLDNRYRFPSLSPPKKKHTHTHKTRGAGFLSEVCQKRGHQSHLARRTSPWKMRRPPVEVMPPWTPRGESPISRLKRSWWKGERVRVLGPGAIQSCNSKQIGSVNRAEGPAGISEKGLPGGARARSEAQMKEALVLGLLLSGNSGCVACGSRG